MCALATCGEGELISSSEQLVGYNKCIARPILDVAYCHGLALAPDWRCILRQPAASHVYLLRLTPGRQADLIKIGTLTLLDQGACNGHSL